ncbi:uncharacterized protein LOC119393298 [Rhipicephalus sanguineus]|uniref:uncharacterized protein LOC119393298 n=1 Tax=Rhipicephalus sanguineus TaxID=34632 RepID=UPI0020C4357C|nr:uncharacterized protein LOC119393298 [Rhipicephalus sanguineus]
MASCSRSDVSTRGEKAGTLMKESSRQLYELDATRDSRSHAVSRHRKLSVRNSLPQSPGGRITTLEVTDVLYRYQTPRSCDLITWPPGSANKKFCVSITNKSPFNAL